MGSVVVVGSVLYFLSRTKVNLNAPALIGFAQTAGPIAGLATISLAYFLHKNKIRKIDNKASLGNKLSAYFLIHILKLALLEGGAMFNIVLFYLIGDTLLLAFAALATIVIALNTPSIFRLGNDLQLNEEEMRILETPDEIIP